MQMAEPSAADYPYWLPDDVWERAADPTLPPGIISINGCHFPLIEYMVSDE